MELNKRDKKMLAWLKKQDAAWPVMRWIILVSSAVSILAFVTTLNDDLVLLIVGVMGLSYTLGSWSGRAETSLLLKLVTEISHPDE